MFLYSGNTRTKFPLEMAEIQGSVVAADINDDGKIELLTTDAHGNVVAWTAQGEEIWEKHLKSLVPQVNFSFHYREISSHVILQAIQGVSLLLYMADTYIVIIIYHYHPGHEVPVCMAWRNNSSVVITHLNFKFACLRGEK